MVSLPPWGCWRGPEDVGEVLEVEVEGVSDVIGVVAEETVAALRYEHADEGDKEPLEDIGRGLAFVRICWSDWRS
jgi:hypothetical protein